MHVPHVPRSAVRPSRRQGTIWLVLARLVFLIGAKLALWTTKLVLWLDGLR